MERFSAERKNDPLESGSESLAKPGQEINQDTILDLPEEGVFGVFDGVGGHKAGEVASRMAAEVVTEEVRKLPAGIGPEELGQEIASMLRVAGEEIEHEAGANPDFQNMATTAAVAKIWESASGDRKAVIVHAGDSRVYLLRDGGLESLTLDHGLIREFASSEEAARRMQKEWSETGDPQAFVRAHPEMQPLIREAIKQRFPEDKVPAENSPEEVRLMGDMLLSVIFDSLGGGGGEPNVEIADVLPGDMLLILSDGITDNLRESEIQKILEGKDPEWAAHDLAAQANARMLAGGTGSKRDDASAVVVRIT